MKGLFNKPGKGKKKKRQTKLEDEIDKLNLRTNFERPWSPDKTEDLYGFTPFQRLNRFGGENVLGGDRLLGGNEYLSNHLLSGNEAYLGNRIARSRSFLLGPRTSDVMLGAGGAAGGRERGRVRGASLSRPLPPADTFSARPYLGLRDNTQDLQDFQRSESELKDTSF